MYDPEAFVIMKDGTVRNLPVYDYGCPVCGYGIDVPIDDNNYREVDVTPDGEYYREVTR